MKAVAIFVKVVDGVSVRRKKQGGIKISYLIDKFKGIYRIKVPYDLSKNDFNRKLNGTLEDIDCYIDCQNNCKIFHYGRDILQGYIPSLTRGRNIIKVINNINPDLIFNIEETDSEILFKFSYKNSDRIIPLFKPKINGANISPFSTKNLPKNKSYKIPEEELSQYKKIVSNIPKDQVLTITHITNDFIKKIAKNKKKLENIKADMKLHCLKSKEYIHFIGKWDDYLKYLKNNLSKI